MTIKQKSKYGGLPFVCEDAEITIDYPPVRRRDRPDNPKVNSDELSFAE